MKRFCVMLSVMFLVCFGAWGFDNGDFRWGSNASGEWKTDTNWTYKGVFGIQPASNDYPGKDGKNGDGNFNDEVYLNTTVDATNDNIVIKLTSNIQVANLYLETSNANPNITIDLNGYNLTVSNDIYIGNKDQTSSDKVNFTITGSGLVMADALHVGSSSLESLVSIENSAALTVVNSVNNSSAGQNGKFSISGDGTGSLTTPASVAGLNFVTVNSNLVNFNGNTVPVPTATDTYYWTGNAGDSEWTTSGNWAPNADGSGLVTAGSYPGHADNETAVFDAGEGAVNLSLAGAGYSLTIQNTETRNNSRDYRVTIAGSGDNADSAKITVKGYMLFDSCILGDLTVDAAATVETTNYSISNYSVTNTTDSLRVKELTLNTGSAFYGIGGSLVVSDAAVNNGNMNVNTLEASFNGGYSGDGNIYVSAGKVTFGASTTNTVSNLSFGGAGTIINNSSAAVSLGTVDCGIENVTFIGNFDFPSSGTRNFKASSTGTYFVNGNVDFTNCTTFNSNSAGGGATLFFYQTEGSRRTFTTQEDMSLANFYFGGNVDIYLNGAVTVGIRCMMSAITSSYNQSADFTAIIGGTGTLNANSTGASIEIDRMTDSAGVVGTLEINADVTCADLFVQHSGTKVKVNSGKKFSMQNDYRGYGAATDPKNEIVVEGELAIGKDFGAGQANEAVVTVASEGKVTVGGDITYASKITNNGTVSVTNSISGVTELVNEAGTITVNDSIPGVSKLNNSEAAELKVQNLISGGEVINGGLIKTSSLNVSGSIDSGSASLIEFIGNGSISISPLASTNKLTNIEVSAEKTLSIASNNVVFSGNVKNNGTIDARTFPLTLKGTDGNLSQISGIGQFVVAKDNFSCEYLSIGSDVTISETAGTPVDWGAFNLVESDGTCKSVPYSSGTVTEADYTNLFKHGWKLKNLSFTWTGVTSTDWGTASNWDIGMVPGLASQNTDGVDVLIPDDVSSGNYPEVGTPSEAYKADNLTIGTQTNSSHNAVLKVSTVGLELANILKNYGKISYSDSARITAGTNPVNDVLNGGTVEYAGSTAQIVTKFASGTDPDYANLLITGNALVQNDLIIEGGLSVASGASFAADSGTTVIFAGDGSSPQKIECDSAAAKAQFTNLEISSGAYVITETGKFEVSGNWTNSNATGGFTSTGGTVIFTGTSTITITGENEFYKLSFTGAGSEIKFAAGKTQKVTHSFSSVGADGNEILLTTDAAAPSEADESTWWKIDVPASAIDDATFTNTKVSYSKSEKIIAHGWADTVSEGTDDSTLNWFISDYYWSGATDSSWDTDTNWKFLINGIFVPAGKSPNYSNGRNSIFIGTNGPAGYPLVLGNDISVKSLTVNDTGTIDLKGFSVDANDSDDTTKDFVNKGKVRLYGTSGQIPSNVRVENGDNSTVEYYSVAAGTSSALELAWGTEYKNLIFGDGSSGTVSSAVTVSDELKILNGTGNSLFLTGANVFANPVVIGDKTTDPANPVSGGKIKLNSDGNLKLGEVYCDSLEIQSSVEFTQDVDSSVSFTGTGSIIKGGGKTFSKDVAFSGAGAQLEGSNVFSDTVTFSAGTTISENNTFSDKFICTTENTILTFASGSTQKVKEIKIKGAEGNEIKLTGSGVWSIEPLTDFKHAIAHAVITNSTFTDGTNPIIVYAKDGYNIDGAGNTNWIFAGQEYVWQGGTTEWGEKSNWLPQVVPGKYSSVSIPGGKANYPVLESEVNLANDEINFVLDSDGILVLGGTTGTAAEKIASSVDIASGAKFDFNGINLTVNKITNAGRIRVQGSETIAASGANGIANFPLDASSCLTGIIEYYGDFGTALNWVTSSNSSFNALEFTSGAKGSESRAISVKEEVLIENGSGNEISLTGANVFESGVKIVSAGTVELAGADSSGEALSISGDSSNIVSCEILKVNSASKFESDVVLEVPSVSFGANVTGSGIIDFKGDFKSFANVNVGARYVLASGSAVREVSASSGSLTFESDVFVDIDSSAEFTISSDINWTKTFCLYSGKVSAGAVNLSGKNLVVFGANYNADDPRYSGSDARFAYYGYDSLQYKKSSGLSGVCSEFSSNSTTVTLSGDLYLNGTDLSGCSFVLPDQSSSHPVFNPSSLVTADQWGNHYAVVFNSKISGCSASASTGSAFVAAASFQNVEDSSGGSGNSGFQFKIPQISEAYSVSDSVICVIFNMDLENSNGEVSNTAALVASLENGGIFYNDKKLHFDGIIYTESDGTDCSVPLESSVLASSDIPASTPLYLKVSSAENKWNTDATALLPGSEGSTDRSGTHREATVDLSLFEGLFYAAQGKTMCRNYGIGLWKEDGESEYKDAEIFATLDKARPVLIDVFAGQELHVKNSGSADSQKFYDSHNFIEFSYSEPVDIGNLLSGDDSKSQNQQAESDFDSESKHGGAILNNFGETGGLTVAGFASIESGELTAGFKSGSGRSFAGEIDSARPHSLYRKFALNSSSAQEFHSNRIRISVAGYVDEANPVSAGESSFHNWLGYIESSTTPSGLATPLANAFIVDLAVDADGNRLKNAFDENNSSRTIIVNDRALAVEDSLYGNWDTLHPVFAPYITNFDDSEPNTSWNNGDSETRQYEMLGTVDSNTNAYIDKIELHLFDNKPAYSPDEPYKWVSGKGWFDGATGEVVSGFSAPESSGGSRAIPVSAAMTLGGIRRSSLEGADSAFSYKYILDSFESETRSFAESKISQHAKSSMFRIEELSETFTDDDGPYLGISINAEDSQLPIRTAFTVTYNPTASFITDLAGNRLIQRDEGSDVKILHTIDITPPSFTMTLSPIGENKIYAVFTKPLAYKGTYLHELGGELDSVLNKIVSNLEFVYSEEDNVDTRSVPDGDSAISVLSAELVSRTNDYTALLFTLSRKISLDDVEKLWLRVNEAGEATDTLFGNITTSFLQDKLGNPVPTHTCHALSDFAVNAVNVLYGRADSYDGDNWSEDQIYGEGLAPDSDDYAVHEFTADGKNYNLLRSGRDLVFQLEFINFYDENGTYGTVNGESLALVYDEKSNIRPEWKSNKYNLFTGSEWRLWLDNHLDALSTNFNASPLSASLPASSPAFENAEGSEVLKNMRWQKDIFNLAAGKEYQFFFKILDSSGNVIKINHDGDKTTQRIPLYAFRMPKERIAAGDFSFIDLWSFRTKDLTRQRGGVTILNNVINASTGEKTAIEVNMKSAGNLNVFVMTLDGNIVKRLSKGSVKAGTHYFYWDGKNNAGNPVARGLYFVRVSGKDIDETRKVMVIKK